jgi:hypothetical protein
MVLCVRAKEIRVTILQRAIHRRLERQRPRARLRVR